MPALENLERLFVVTAFLFQIVLIVHFALRRWRFDIVQRYGWIVYVLAVPAAVISMVLLRAGKPWLLWLGGFLYLGWGVFGYVVEFALGIEWRNAKRWTILIPYLTLYLATSMFYWWPLGLLWRPLWYVQAIFFGISTALNAASHKGPQV
jgi:hypothetical protein